MDDVGTARRVLVTGAAGYIGRQLIGELAAAGAEFKTVVALDVRAPGPAAKKGAVRYRVGDVRAPSIESVFREHAIDTVVHLAAIVTPGKGDSAEFAYSVDVGGTENVLRICAAAGVSKIIVTSSGAAYGYHADSPARLCETDALRGNDVFAYSRHKRLVEEMLARWRREHPELRQLVFRVGTILGAGVANQITALFEKPLVLGIRGSDAPFVFAWDRDVVGCLMRGVRTDLTGIYNLAGDGVVTLREIARRTGKPYVALPAWVVRGALAILCPLGLSRYGPEQVDFLRYRPVLANAKLKEEFGYIPRRTSREVFDLYLDSRHG